MSGSQWASVRSHGEGSSPLSVSGRWPSGSRVPWSPAPSSRRPVKRIGVAAPHCVLGWIHCGLAQPSGQVLPSSSAAPLDPRGLGGLQTLLPSSRAQGRRQARVPGREQIRASRRRGLGMGPPGRDAAVPRTGGSVGRRRGRTDRGSGGRGTRPPGGRVTGQGGKGEDGRHSQPPRVGFDFH